MTTYAELAADVRARPPRLGGVRLVAVDGPSGAGKTVFAGRLAAASDAPVVHTDDLLDGWDDQFTFWTRFEERVLTPLRSGRPARYQRYSWHRRRFTGPEVVVPPSPVVVVEGVSAARREIRPELTMAVFVQAPAELRLDRALSRDHGDDVAFAAYLERWRAAEDRHFTSDDTAARADLVVDGAAEGPDQEFTVLRRGRPAEPRSRA